MNGDGPEAPWIDAEVRRYSRGWGLVGTVVLVFLVPLGTAAAGGYVADALASYQAGASHALWQMLGMLVGLAVGVCVAKLVMLAMNRRSTGCSERSRSSGETE